MRSRLIPMLAGLPVLLIAAGAGAEVPLMVNYQGVLADEVGNPLDGSYELTFEIFADAGMTSNPLWAETHPDVEVIDGVFNAVLGSVSPIPVGLWEVAERWLAVTVDGGDAIEPLMHLTSVPYALRAAVADSLAGGGSGAGDGHSLDAADGDPVDVVYVDNDGVVTVGDDRFDSMNVYGRLFMRRDENQWLEVFSRDDYGHFLYGRSPESNKKSLAVGSLYDPGGSSAGEAYIRFIIGNVHDYSTPMVIKENGNVGMGTSAPQAKLDVAGAVRTQGFQMPSGAGEGWVLTSDISGVGTWQPAGGTTGDGDWIVAGDDMYAANSGNVGVGVTDPGAKLDVAGDGLVIRAFSNGARAGVYGKHVTTGNYGYVGYSNSGVSGYGGDFPGVYAESDSVAVYGFNSGTRRTKGYLGGSYGAYGESSAGNYGYLGGASFAVYGNCPANANYGGIGYWNYAVLGDSESHTGVLGRSDGSTGVAGETTTGWGVYGTHLASDNYGYIAGTDYAMFAWAENASSTAFYGRNANAGNFGTIGTEDDAVYAESNNDNAIHGVSPYGNAGLFEGNVTVTGGHISTPVIQITGGSDLSERFEVRATATGAPPQPGHLVSLDPERPGQLMLSSEAYDKKVAGVISGAGGVNPGLLMGQEGSLADGSSPVALTGRVYCWADATGGPIEPGDLLTTSDLPGHAMKANDRSRAHGTIIGKAMTALGHGQGLVLVLVNLQ